jgi:hypothetical protein
LRGCRRRQQRQRRPEHAKTRTVLHDKSFHHRSLATN